MKFKPDKKLMLLNRKVSIDYSIKDKLGKRPNTFISDWERFYIFGTPTLKANPEYVKAFGTLTPKQNTNPKCIACKDRVKNMSLEVFKKYGVCSLFCKKTLKNK